MLKWEIKKKEKKIAEFTLEILEFNYLKMLCEWNLKSSKEGVQKRSLHKRHAWYIGAQLCFLVLSEKLNNLWFEAHKTQDHLFINFWVKSLDWFYIYLLKNAN